MKKYRFDSWSRCYLTSAIILTVLLTGCAGESSSPSGAGQAPLPAEVFINKAPDQTAYGSGEPVDVSTLVLDGAGNTLSNVSLEITSEPPADEQAGDRFIYLNDGIYTITVTVLGNTQDGEPLSASIEIVVDGQAPVIACDDPIDGAILSRAPGDVTVQGLVSDMTSGISELLVNGTPAAVDEFGAFSAVVPGEWGINFIKLAAFDRAGHETRRTCSFLLSETWAPDDQVLPNTLSTMMRQRAIDDAYRPGAVNSTGDILHRVLNSTRLRDGIHSALLASNPLKPSACDAHVLSICVLRSEVIHLNTIIGGPNTTGLNLVSGGLSNSATGRDIRLQVRVTGAVSGIPYDTTGWVTFSHGTTGMTFDTKLSGGSVRVSIRPSSTSASLGSVSTDFSGLDGAVINILVDLFNSTVRNLVAGLLRDYIQDNFNGVLDDVFSQLDISSLDGSYNVPRLDGAGDVPLTFAADFSSLNASTVRFFTGMGTQFQATPAHARPTLGAPIPFGALSLDIPSGQPMVVAMNTALLNQALHALWRGGYFDSALVEGDLGGLIPAGVSLGIGATLPPVVQVLDNGRLEISAGAVNVSLIHPALSGETLDLSLGGRSSCAPALAGEALLLEDCTVDELHLSDAGMILDAETWVDLEDFIIGILNEVLATAVENSLPALPIPSLPLPPSVEVYGIPGGSEMGMLNPAIRTEGNHLILEGEFGLR